ncbi:Aste57867_10212 [Aphanomyces stellatus]|uniref:Aste57867_10212 protein n=1 Tax=Aphanomyces stellatus TaxID=120398 RepID=A0A485KQA3_9STRA|nr:hypothetical protein As57867_010173 [Aphanomyces stellatus]VFT87088.1 Aste57867_10212 [Aphanomyces stellatus]
MKFQRLLQSNDSHPTTTMELSAAAAKRQYYKEWYEKNKAKRQEYNLKNRVHVREWHLKHRDRVLEHKKKYREKNRQKEMARHKKYFEANRERILDRARMYREKAKLDKQASSSVESQGAVREPPLSSVRMRLTFILN